MKTIRQIATIVAVLIWTPNLGLADTTFTASALPSTQTATVPKEDAPRIKGGDAPRYAWWSKAWNVDTERLKSVEKKFGPSTKWNNGGAICGEENAGYQWKVGDRTYWVVFFEAELGAGMRVSYSLLTAATLGFADTCERPVTERQVLPKSPFPSLRSAFQTPIPVGTSQSEVLSKLGTPDSQWTSPDGTLMMGYSWDCRKCHYNFPQVGELEGVQTDLKVGFRDKKLEHFEFSRAWGL